MDEETREPLIIHEHREPIKTLRDEFAMAALSGMLADPGVQVGGSNDKITAKLCYDLADAMLQARSSSTPSKTPTTNSSQ